MRLLAFRNGAQKKYLQLQFELSIFEQLLPVRV